MLPREEDSGTGSIPQKLCSQSKHGDRPPGAKVYSNVLVWEADIPTAEEAWTNFTVPLGTDVGCSCLESNFHGR